MSGPPPDPSRRRFFRQFAGEVVSSAAQLVGAMTEVRDRSTAEAQAMLRGDPADEAGRAAPGGAKAAAASPPPAAAPPTGFRTPFRFDAADDHLLLAIDQRALPDELVEARIRSAYAGARVIREMAVRGAPAIGQVAALSLALSGWLARNAPPNAFEGSLRAAAKHLAAARPTAVNLGWAVGRVMAAFDAARAAGATGPEVAAAMRAEADRIVAEATDDHGSLAEHGLAILPEVGDRELRILTHCNTEIGRAHV